MENIGCLERFVTCDLKVGTYIQLIELMKSYEYSRAYCHLLTLAKGHLHIIFKTHFFSETTAPIKAKFTCAILSKGN